MVGALSTAEAYWQSFLATLPADDPARHVQCVADKFGDTPDLAHELGTLILTGRKTATCSSLWEWEAEGEPLPQVGHRSIVLDGGGQPLCVIETTEVMIRPYNEVDAQFAANEGEGDLSLEYWRAAHWRFFARTLARIGKEPEQDMPLVCERFRVIYR